jgi:hypothetical protein
MKYAYAQTTTPLPIFQIGEAAEKFHERGWEMVAPVYFSLGMPTSKISLPQNQRPAPVPLYMLVFRKGYEENEEKPRPPEDIVIGGQAGNTLPFPKE